MRDLVDKNGGTSKCFFEGLECLRGQRGHDGAEGTEEAAIEISESDKPL